MIILNAVDLIVKAKGHLHLDLIFGLVLPVTAPRKTFKELNRGQVLALAQFIDIVNYTILITKPFGGSALFVNEFKDQSGVDHRLPFQNIPENLKGYPDIGEDLTIRLPFLQGAGMLIVVLFLFKSADIVTLFKMEFILITIAEYSYIHVF